MDAPDLLAGSASGQVEQVSADICDRNGKQVEKSIWVIRERPVTLYINGREVVTLLCAGQHLDELAVGFFYSEGFVKSPEDVRHIEVDEGEGKVNFSTANDDLVTERLWQKRTITSGCGKGSVFYYSLDALLSRPVESGLRVSPARILDRMEEMNRLSETYRKTHGVHNALLATAERTILFREDIGRHNAVDMIVGHVFLQKISLGDKILVTTGRLTSEMLIKAAKVGIPVVVSRNTATSLAVELATALRITLIGHAKAGKFIVYSGRERIDADLSG